MVGATNSVLSVTNAGVTSGGSYYVAVTSTNGVAISRPALVQVGNSGLLAWGYNANGQLGNGSQNGSPVPSWVTTNVATAAAGYAHTVYLDNTGILWGMGQNLYGQLGNGNHQNVLTPQAIASNVVAMAAGAYHTLFIQTNGTLWGMGLNGVGQLGNGDLTGTNVYTPQFIATNVVAVAAGYLQTMFIQANGNLWGMGQNNYGQLGNGDPAGTNVFAPQLITSNVMALTAGWDWNLFIRTNGTLWGMGESFNGQLGLATLTATNLPVPVATNVVAVAAGAGQTMFIQTNGTLWGLGYNAYGQLGNGTTNNTRVAVAVASNVVAVAAGWECTLFVQTNGTLWGMGQNNYGQLGLSTPAVTSVPLPVTGVYSLAGVFSGCTASSTYAAGLPTAPAITMGPVNQTVAAGGTATFTATAAGTNTLAYQWYLYGSPVSGAASTNATLTLTNAQFAISGSYTLVVTNAYGSVTSSVATLTVVPPVAVTNQPANQTVPVGGTATFTVAATGTAPLAYQWYFGGSAISGPAGTNFTLTLTNVQISNAGNYQLVVTNAYSSVTSSVAGLTVFLPATVTNQPVNQTVAVNGTINLSVTAGGSGPLAYQWFKNSVPVAGATNNVLSVTNAGVKASGSYYLTVTSPYCVAISRPALVLAGNPYLLGWGLNNQGQQGNSGLLVENTQAMNAVASNAVAAAEGFSHTMYIDNNGILWGMGGNASGQLGNGDPTGTNVLTPQMIASNVVAVAGGPAFTLFIQTNGILSGMGDNSYGQLGNLAALGTNVLTPQIIASNVVAAVAGQYNTLFIQANGTLWGMGNGGNFYAPAVVASNVVMAAAGASHVMFLQMNGTLWGMGGNSYGQLGKGTVTYTNLPPVAVASNVVAVAAGQNHTLFMQANGTLWGMGYNYFGQVGNGNLGNNLSTPQVMASNVVAVAAGANYTMFMQTNGTLLGMGQNNDGQLGNGTWNFTTNNVPSAVGAVYSPAGVFSGSSAFTTFAVGLPTAPVIAAGPTNQTILPGGTARFTVTAPGTNSLAYQWYFNGSAISGSTGTNATLTLTNVQTNNVGSYMVVITNAYGSVSSSAATLVMAVPAYLAGQPTNRTVVPGGIVAFAVTAGGTAPLAYQWYYGTNTISGPSGTNFSLTLTSVQTNNAGNYRVVVTNVFGSVTSSVAVLTVVAPSAVTSQPTNQTVAVGGTINLSVAVAAAGGAGPMAYQWYANGMLLTGATNSALSVTNAGQANSGSYYVVVTGPYDLVISRPALVSVGSPRLLAWGANGSGQLGLNNTSNSIVPLTVASNAVVAAAGQNHTMYLDNNGTLWGMGDNTFGELGKVSGTNLLTPQAIASNVVTVAAGQGFTMFIQTNGTLWGMGLNNYGQLGNGTAINTNVPVAVASNVVAVAAGGRTRCMFRQTAPCGEWAGTTTVSWASERRRT